MINREVYEALVLPADFSSNAASLQTETPEKAKNRNKTVIINPAICLISGFFMNKEG